MLEREGIQFENTIQSDCADVSGLVQKLLQENITIHCMRDLTRGGLASGLIELASSAKQHFNIQQSTLPIQQAVNSACEILGFDPLYIANEGCFCLFVPQSDSQKTLNTLQKHPLGQQACIIGEVIAKDTKGRVTLETDMGIKRTLDLFSGEQLPRIC